jgi:hypothetical protein
MARASYRSRRKKISFLNQDEGLIQGDRHVLLFATSFYKNMFGPSNVDMGIGFDDLVSNVLDDNDRELLGKPFTVGN